jgi:DNA polymerase-3 subunit delta'
VGFAEFLGNQATVRHLRESIASGRIPQSLLIAGPAGAGKYTLALFLAMAVNCRRRPHSDGLPDFCGECGNCSRIRESLDLDRRVEEAVAAREEMRDADRKDTRILIQTHPDVMVVPPDPPQLLIKLGQVRSVIHAAYYRRPAEAERAFFVFSSAQFMKEAANSLLKLLEEPPAHASIVLLAENPGELLPTIRSRTLLFRLGAVAAGQIEAVLAARRLQMKPAERELVARLAQGAVGRALAFDLPAYLESRRDALLFLHTALREPDFSALFRTTEAYRAGPEGQQKTRQLVAALRSLLEDLLVLACGSPELVRNLDIAAELARMAAGVSLAWLEQAARGASAVEAGLRRNLLRSLSLDAFAADLIRA